MPCRQVGLAGGRHAPIKKKVVGGVSPVQKRRVQKNPACREGVTDLISPHRTGQHAANGRHRRTQHTQQLTRTPKPPRSYRRSSIPKTSHSTQDRQDNGTARGEQTTPGGLGGTGEAYAKKSVSQSGGREGVRQACKYYKGTNACNCNTHNRYKCTLHLNTSTDIQYTYTKKYPLV